jgi:chemotaxis protein methyltransferase CheR
MTLADSRAALPRDAKILATDISTKVLEAAEAGTYRYEQLRKGMDDAAIKRHFERDGNSGNYAARDALRGMIAFRYLNLLSEYPFRKLMDVVFLRNVLIYFGTKEKEEVLRRIGEVLKPGGLLLVGLSESLVGVRHGFKMARNSIYTKE